MKLPHPGSMGVDPATGNFYYSARDLDMPCRGRLRLQIHRYYNSNTDHPWNRLLAGWNFSFDERLRFEYAGKAEDLLDFEAAGPAWRETLLVVDDTMPVPMLQALTVLYPNGARHRFQVEDAPGGQLFSAVLGGVRRFLRFLPASRQWRLELPGFGFHLFGEDGKLAAMEDAFGNRIRLDWAHVHVYAGGPYTTGQAEDEAVFSTPQLVALTDPVGRTLRFSSTPFPANTGLRFRRTMTDWTGRTWHYDFQNAGHLHAFTDPEGHVTRYHRGGDPGAPTFSPPKGLEIPNLPGVEAPILDRGLLGLHKIEFPNGDFLVNYPSGARPLAKRVGVQVLGDRLAVNHVYDLLGRRTTRLVGSPENAWVYEFDEGLNLTRAVDPMGNEYRSEYDPAGRLVGTVDPRLSRTRYEYDARDNLVRVRDPEGRETSYDYDQLDNVVRWTGPGPEAPAFLYDYHPTSGVLLSQVDPAGRKATFEYTPHGQLAATRNERGARWSYRYDSAGHLVAETDPLGHTTRFERDALGRLTRIASPEGRFATLAYDRLDRLVALGDAEGGIWTFEYDGNSNLVRTVDPEGAEVRVGFDVLGNAVRVVDALGQVTRFDYDAPGNLVRRVDALGREQRLEYDRVQRLVAAVDPEGFAWRREHEPYCGSTRWIDPLGRTTTLHRDVLCRETEVEFPEGGVVRKSYDPEGRLASVTDPAGGLTRFGYDRAGRVTEIMDPLGQVESRAYDESDNLVLLTDRKGLPTRLEHDAAGRLVRLVRRDGTTVTCEHDRDGLLTARTDGRGQTWRFRHDRAGRRVGVLDPEGHWVVRNVYDRAGRLVEQLDALGHRTLIEYDALGRQVTVTDPAGNRSVRTWDPVGNPVALVDPRGRITRLAYDRLDRLVAVVDPDGGVLRRVLDAVGNPTALLDQNGNGTYYEYDGKDRVTAEVDADGLRLEWEYDRLGNPVVQRDPRGFRTTFHHDPLQRLVRVRYEDEAEATFAYDANGNLVRRTDGTGTCTWEYDAEDRVVANTGPGGARLRMEHDAEGHRTALVLPDGSRQEREYDAAGRLAALVHPGGGRTSFRFDAAGRRTRIDRPNGTWTLCEFDPASRLSRLAHFGPSGEKLTPDLRMTRDESGNVLALRDGETPLWTYGYDRLDRLVSAVDHRAPRSWEWTYDPAGNRLGETVDGVSTPASYNRLNQLVQQGETRFWHDLAGNLSHRSGPEGASRYRFDSRDRLVEVHTAEGRRLRYSYDSFGRMVTRWPDPEATPTRFEWDGWDLVREVAPDGVETLYYAPHGEILSFKRGSSVYQVHADALGSVRSITAFDGSTNATFAYDAWGQAIASSNTTSESSFRFVGSRGVMTDAASGLLSMRLRWYDPSLGVFIGRDPLRTANRYTYARNNPLKFIDPSGLLSEQQDCQCEDPDALNNVVWNWLAEKTNRISVPGPYGHADPSKRGQGPWNDIIQDTYEVGGTFWGRVEYGIVGVAVLATVAVVGLGAVESAGFATGAQAEAWWNLMNFGRFGGGLPQVGVKTPLGRRIIDYLIRSVAQEVKSGACNASSRIATQVAKDASILAGESSIGTVSAYEWHFFRSAVTGQVGPSAELAQILRELGIRVVVHF